MKIQDPSRFSRINNSFDEYVTLFAGNLANFRRDNKFEKYSENFTGTRMHYIHLLQSNVRISPLVECKLYTTKLYTKRYIRLIPCFFRNRF